MESKTRRHWIRGTGLLLMGLAAIAAWVLWPRTAPPVDERLLKPRMPSGSTNGNAVFLLERATALFCSTNELNQIVRNRNDDAPPDRESAQRLLDAEAEALGLIREAFRQPQCELTRAPEWTTNDLVVPNWGALARLASLEAELWAADGASAPAWNRAGDLVALGHRLEDSGGDWFTYLAACSTKRTGLRLMRRLAARGEVSADQLQRRILQLESFPSNGAGLTNAVAWMFRHGILDLSNTITMAGVAFPVPGGSTLALSPPRLLYDPNRTRRRMAQQHLDLLAALATPGEETIDDADSRGARTSPFLLLIQGNAVGTILADMAASSGQSLFRTARRENNEVAATRLLLALRAYQEAEGHLPEALERLVPTYLDRLPRDAFDGEPLRYSRERRCIWSVGPNRVDDGGIARNAAKEILDDVFELGW
ncbi:MAG: hypothetical protein KF791_16405 [Verrucomicrobiae bacterium]|nr:hypothetical protein [Verrucomicrobiae bacterium]